MTSWEPTGDGKLRCTAHGETFAPGRHCGGCATTPVQVEVEAELGDAEQLTAEAQRRGLMGRLEVEAMLAGHAELADAKAMEICKRAAQYLAKAGPKSPTAAESVQIATALYNAGVKWHAEASKTWRGLKDMVFDRERRADAEKFERLHGRRSKHGGKGKRSGGGVN